MAKKKAPDKNEHVVIAFFSDQGAATRATDALKRWDDADDEIKLGSYGLLAMMDGEIKAYVGRKTGKGAGVGAILGVIAGVLADVTHIGGLIPSSKTKGSVGAFMKDSLHMTKQDIEELSPELSAGKVALVVTCDDYEVTPTQAQLTSLGGTVRGYVVPAKALAAAVAAGVGDDWPTEPFEPEPFEPEPFEPESIEAEAIAPELFEPFAPEPLEAERTAALPEFTVAAPGPTTASAQDLSTLRAEVF